MWLASGLLLSFGACAREDHAIIVDTVELAVGDYYGLDWGGTQVERFHVLAHRGTRDGEVVIVSPQLATPCSLGRLAGYEPLRPANGGKYVLGSPSPARIAVFDQLDTHNRGRLGFVGLDCKRIALELPDIDPGSVRRLPPTELMQLSLAVPTSDHRLLFVNPWAETTTSVATDVSSVQVYGAGLWLIEGGHAVKRNLDGKELARHGRGVTELLPLNVDGDLIYVDERGVVLRQEGTETTIAEDGCRLRTLDGFAPGAIGYHAPCGSPNLEIRTKDGMKYRYAQKIDVLKVGAGRVFFTVNGEATTALWMVAASAPDEPQMIVALPTFHLDAVSRPSAQRLNLTVTQADGTIALLQLDLVADKLTVTTLDDSITELNTYENGIAVLKANGTLSLSRYGSTQALMRAKGVRNAGFRFMFSGEATALAYMSNVDPDTGLGTLQLQFLTGEHFVLAEEVRELREVWWPETGILYATGGSHPAMHFAHVDVPCEVVSDSPWACGF